MQAIVLVKTASHFVAKSTGHYVGEGNRSLCCWKLHVLCWRLQVIILTKSADCCIGESCWSLCRWKQQFIVLVTASGHCIGEEFICMSLCCRKLFIIMLVTNTDHVSESSSLLCWWYQQVSVLVKDTSHCAGKSYRSLCFMKSADNCYSEINKSFCWGKTVIIHCVS